MPASENLTMIDPFSSSLAITRDVCREVVNAPAELKAYRQFLNPHWLRTSFQVLQREQRKARTAARAKASPGAHLSSPGAARTSCRDVATQSYQQRAVSVRVSRQNGIC